jgi:hypothetical protein
MWIGIKNRKLTIQEKNFASATFVRKHPNFDIYNPIYSLSKITDSKLVRLWVMLFDVLKETAKHDLNDRQVNLFKKWELATIVLSKENQNGPLSQQLLHLFDVNEKRLSREMDKVKFILLNFLDHGIQSNNEFLKSQIIHGSSPHSVLIHVRSLMMNFGERLSTSNTNDSQSTSIFTNRVLWISSMFSCPHSTVWSHSSDNSSQLEPLVIWKCTFGNKYCDAIMASMMTKNVTVLDFLCKRSCQSVVKSEQLSEGLMLNVKNSE